MRKVIFGINLTIDGCCDHTKLSGNDEIFEYITNDFRNVDLFVFGRKTYQLMVPFLSQLVESGIIDEYHFIVHPIVAGEGRRLLEGISLQEKLQLKLVESTVFKSGCVALRYLKQ
jgi:dihydrofolate reductase